MKKHDAMLVSEHRRRHKQELVYVLGGKCQLCGFDLYIEALEFHHINPSEKKFQLSSSTCRSLKSDLEEAEKCA